jgi:hypothetical protein
VILAQATSEFMCALPTRIETGRGAGALVYFEINSDMGVNVSEGGRYEVTDELAGRNLTQTGRLY